MSGVDNGQNDRLARDGVRRGRAVIVAGPTASGKSGLACELAEALGGVVVNADSMQVYAGLPILTAQPDETMRRRVPHRLYGVLAPDDVCSAGRWLDLVRAEVDAVWAEGRLPVIVGGTGLYLRVAINGLAAVPPVPDAVRESARSLLRELGNEAFHRRLASLDPVMAARLHPANSQRLARAYEVVVATGRSLADWQAQPAQGRVEADWFTILLSPPPEDLRRAANTRFLAMIEAGAILEAQRMAEAGYDCKLPAMKALGLPELMAHLAGQISLEDAVTSAQLATWHYAKRQRTWFRHQFIANETINQKFSKSQKQEIFSKIIHFLLTPSI